MQNWQEYTAEPDMHRERRKLLLRAHPEIRALMGYDTRTLYVTVGVFAVHLAVAYGVSTRKSALVTILVSYVVGAILNHWLGMTIHETSHNLAVRTPLGNRVLALFANLPMVIPIAMTFHRYHIEHHKRLGQEGQDTDLPTAWEIRWIGTSRWRKFLWLLPYMIVYGIRGATFAKRPNAWEIANALIQVVASYLAYRWLGAYGFAYLALSTFFGHSLHPVAAHFIHEHYLFAPGQETYSYYGPLNHVTFNVGYHVEHHDFMNIAGWRLPALHAFVPHAYRSLTSHRSWTRVLYDFVMRKDISVASRRVRSAP